MKRAMLLALVGLGFGVAPRAKADIAPPLPPAKSDVAVTIEVDEKAKGPRLVVPNGVFTLPRVRPMPKTSDPKGELPHESQDGIAEETAPSNNKLLIAGIALSLSLTCGGFWMLRRNGKGSMTGLSLLLAAGVTVAAGTIVMGNAAPRRGPLIICRSRSRSTRPPTRARPRSTSSTARSRCG